MRWLRSLPIAIALLLGEPHDGRAGEIHPDLQAAMNAAAPGDLLHVGLTMSSQADPRGLNTGGLNRREKRALIVRTLKTHAAATQAAILASMNNPLPGELVQDVRSTWIFNGVSAKANVAAINSLAARADVSLASLVEPGELPGFTCKNGAHPACSNCCNCEGGGNPPCDPPCWHCNDARHSPAPCSGYPSFPPIVSWASTWINADDVWSLGYRGDGVSIGFIDIGFDYTHPDLAPNHLRNIADPPGDAWPNPPGTCLGADDDDCNGKPDDFLGWDITAGDNDPIEARESPPFCASTDTTYAKAGTHHHGTSMLSIAVGAGVGNGGNSYGDVQVTGVAPHAWFVPIKSGNPSYQRIDTLSCADRLPADPSDTGYCGQGTQETEGHFRTAQAPTRLPASGGL